MYHSQLVESDLTVLVHSSQLIWAKHNSRSAMVESDKVGSAVGSVATPSVTAKVGDGVSGASVVGAGVSGAAVVGSGVSGAGSGVSGVTPGHVKAPEPKGPVPPPKQAPKSF